MTDPSSTHPTTFADAVAAVAPSVVRVSARRGPSATGIAFAPDLILTADHAIDPQSEGAIKLGLPDGAEKTGTLVGRDAATDLAVIRVADSELTPGKPAAGPPRVGTLAVLVARPDRDLQASLGLVTGLGGPSRTRRGGMLERYLLVDAVMYPGFSGGPLVDAEGGILGLNTSGLSVGGPSVAIPWDLAISLARTIAEHGSVRRGYLGIGSQPVPLEGPASELTNGQDRGLLVVHIAPEGPAHKAGFLQGDILVTLDGTPIRSADDLQGMLVPPKVGTTLAATLIRAGGLQQTTITVGVKS